MGARQIKTIAEIRDPAPRGGGRTLIRSTQSPIHAQQG